MAAWWGEQTSTPSAPARAWGSPLWVRVMSERLQFIIMAAFAALCFGCGYLTAFIVTRNHWRDEMIERHIARYNWHTGKWEWGEPPKER